MSATTTGTLDLLVNGVARPISATRIPDLLRELGHDPSLPGVAVAVNDAVVRRSEWTAVTLRPGDRVEIVSAKQGG